MGANIPGKARESLNFVGGLPFYLKSLSDSLENNFSGFSVA